jgi:DNA-binding MarR family transcriptional regulator
MHKPKTEREVDRTLALAGDLRVVLGRLRRRLREQARIGDLTVSQGLVLSRLERDGAATVTALAFAEGMRPQSMGAIIAALEAVGLVKGEPDPADGRSTILAVTPKCRELFKADRMAREDWLSRAIRSTLGRREQESLAGAVDLLRRLADAGTDPAAKVGS